MKINNTIYDTLGHEWWNDDAGFEISSLRHCMNPLRYAYFKKKLKQIILPGKTVLDIGCGGGFLSEEFAKDGFQVTGLDPAANSIEAARAHAAQFSLQIDYYVGAGESLPFPDGAFSVVACCDVLEHVDDVTQVTREIARTLKPGGVFLFDTVNRTLKSKIVLIKVWQDWNFAGFSEENAHVWEKFIKPAELSTALLANGLKVCELRGISPRKNPAALLMALLKIRKGNIKGEAVAKLFEMHETSDLSLSYMGIAQKSPTTNRQ